MVTRGLHESEKQVVSVPSWINVMSRSKFFIGCDVHGSSKKTELDRFCIDCLSSLCPSCLPNHTSHKHVKIRRYVYSDVIKRQDLRKLFDCSGIQTYRTNKAKVLFLRRRSSTLRQQRQENNSRDFYSCIVCGRSLQDNTLYCSIECKVSVDGENHKDADEKRIDENIVKLKPRQSSRKGVPFRAPMF
ncbi:uncharacterized protein At3g50808-like [Tripterygium wilfordii]|uniref:uncharacterized protein At3g50808-like n=1 Tax=Tripterygium wilfordii TaxID=458696 RepID=UPI0018F8537F|nr:uncharacterized protein At3g50808-like [Tripterygium wilfordii]